MIPVGKLLSLNLLGAATKQVTGEQCVGMVPCSGLPQGSSLVDLSP